MNLLFVIKSLNAVGGGAERVLADVANGLVEAGHLVTVLTFDSPGGRAFYPLDGRIARIDTGLGDPERPTPRLALLRNLPRLRRLIGDSNADLVVAFMHSSFVPVAASLVATGVPLVFSEHIDAAHYRSRPIERFLVRAAFHGAIAKTVPSKPLRTAHPASQRSKVYVLPNAVNVASFSSAVSRPPQEPPRLLSVGRFMAQKNHLELIRAFALVAPAFPDWTLRIVGEGRLRAHLEREVSRLGLTSRVEMPGVMRDMAAEYAAASIVALPSLYESFGLAAAEALASGRPLIAFDHCLGISAIVENGRNGLLVAGTGDRVTSLSKGLETLMKDRILRTRLGAAGPASVTCFSPTEVVRQWEAFLQLLLPSGAASRAGGSSPKVGEGT